MDSKRKFSDDEVAEILDRATEAQTTRTPASSDATGLTLRELHEIGKEVGISEDEITRAAHSLTRAVPGATSDRKFLGQTIGVGRTIELPRPLTDQEWHRLVVDLRETFDAKGILSEDGVFRQWTNSNLQALLEPSGSGQRLRLRTVKGTARPYQGMGAGFMGGSLVLGIGSLLGMARDPLGIAIIGVMGAAFFFTSRLTVPAWARSRARQFEEIIERVQYSIEATALAPGEPTDDTVNDSVSR